MGFEDLISEVFDCRRCEGASLPFIRNSTGKFYRFPPIIGSPGNVPLLFVGINPRVSPTNQSLHDELLASKTTFEELSRNRVNTREYIGLHGLERHYQLHVTVAKRLFPDRSFDSVASVTELHFCASHSSLGLPYNTSRCADHYFEAVLATVSPRVVFAVGRHVARTLHLRYSRNGMPLFAAWRSGRAPIILLPHPNSFGSKCIDAAIAEAKQHLASVSQLSQDHTTSVAPVLPFGA